MSENRKTMIIDEEIEDFESDVTARRDAIFEKFKLALLNEDPTRLLGKFYHYCNEYVNFEFDESALNMEEAEDILRKINILRDKLIHSLEETLSYKFENIKTDTMQFQISFRTTIEDIKYNVIIEIYPDSFDLEIL